MVAVTRFCHYPPEVLRLPKVAGFADVNYEAVLRQRPDLVVLPVDKRANREELERLGLPVMTLDTRNLDGYLATVEEIGRTTGHLPEAELIKANLANAMSRARARAAGNRKPRVVCSGMTAMEGAGQITEITAVGNDGFCTQMLETAGGENIYQGPLPFPSLTREAIMTLNPEVIIDLARDGSGSIALADWLSLGDSIDAVKNGRLVIFTEESDNVPGPRIHMTITRLSEALFPPAADEDSLKPGASGQSPRASGSRNALPSLTLEPATPRGPSPAPSQLSPKGPPPAPSQLSAGAHSPASRLIQVSAPSPTVGQATPEALATDAFATKPIPEASPLETAEIEGDHA